MSILERAANLSISASKLPPPSEVVTALLDREKAAKKERFAGNFTDLIGTWKLRFVTGTKKTREKAGVVLGAGRYIPAFTNITITYSLDKDKKSDRGRVENKVKLGIFTLSLTGPVKFIEKKNILAFDFTAINIEILGLKLYRGYIRGGKDKESNFFKEKIGKQAFFAYFLIEDSAIAARGKGGGLALWSRI